MAYDVDSLPDLIELGNLNELGVSLIKFDVTDWLTDYPLGVFNITYIRPGETDVYPVDVTGVSAAAPESGNLALTLADEVYTLTWTVSDAVTATAGSGSIVVELAEGGTIKKRSDKVQSYTADGHAAAGDPPEPLADYIEKWSDVDITVTGVAHDVAADGDITQDADGTHISLDIPAGHPGVYVGAEEPTDPDVMVWIDEDDPYDDELQDYLDAGAAAQTAAEAARDLAEGYAAELADDDAEYRESLVQRPLSVKTELKSKKACVSFIDDDGSPSIFSVLKPVLDAKGIKMNFCVYCEAIQNGDPGVITPAQLIGLQSDGHEILSHGWITNKLISNTPESDYLIEFGKSKLYLKSIGLDVNSFVWQGGDYTQSALNAIPYYYDSAWAIDGALGINSTQNRPFEQYKAHRLGFDGITLAAAKAEIDNVVSGGGWMVFMTHCWYPAWDSAKIADFGALIDYIGSLNVDIVTVKEGLERWGNVIDYGRVDNGKDYFKLTKQGEVINKYNRFFSQEENTVFVDTPPSYFKENSINITLHNSQTTATGFPSVQTGTLVTKKGFSGDVMQTWYPATTIPTSANHVFYYRKSENETTWGEFKQSAYVVRKDYTFVSPTIAANSYQSKTLDITDMGLVSGAMVEVTFANLPAWVIWSYVATHTTVTFTFQNLTASSITGQTIYPKVVAFTQ